MNTSRASEILRQWDRKGRYVFRKQDLEKLFPEEAPKTFAKSLRRLVNSGLLMRAGRGVYVNVHANSFKGTEVIEEVAKALRPGEYNYVSLESMLSEYGAISQIPIDVITVMTTGRKGTYRTPFGTIEFTHTARPVHEIAAQVKRAEGRALRFASPKMALRDLKRVGRNVNMVDENWEKDDE